MSRAVKLTISIPEEDFREIEAIRKRNGTTRSGVVAKALKLFREREEKEKLLRQYEEGYKKHPETPLEIKAWEEVSIETFSSEDWK